MLHPDTFKTKKSLESYIRQIINDQDIPSRFPLHSDVGTFLFEVLRRHPRFEEKTANGVSAFVIQKNYMGQHRMVLFETTAGELIDFSWKKCVHRIERSPQAKLLAALRHGISFQIFNFREQKKLIDAYTCNACGTNTGLLEVDHVIQFSMIVGEFLITQIHVPFEFNSTAIGETFLDKDQDFLLSWQNFHEENSELQLLCVSCHKKKTAHRKKSKIDA